MFKPTLLLALWATVTSALAAPNKTNSTMRSAYYPGQAYKMEVRDLPMPTLMNETDAIVRITTAAICGSDLHVYHGIARPQAHSIGHEAVGYVSQVGSAVSALKVGQYVVIPDQPGHGHFDASLGAPDVSFFGGDLGGLQAQYARVPFADTNLIPIPLTRNTTTRALEQSYLTVSDIFPTAWTGLSFSGFQPGDTVAVFGAGPVGQLVAYSAHLRGASRIYVVDSVPLRLQRAAQIAPSVMSISLNGTDPVAAILKYEPGGVVRAVDAVGYEAVNASGKPDEGAVLRAMLGVVRRGGGMGQVGVYGVAPESGISGNVTFPLARFWQMGYSLRGGGVDPLPLAPHLVELIEKGVANTSFIRTAEVGIEDVPRYYERFSKHEEIKVYVHFP